MADWVHVNKELGLQPIAETSTTARHDLGKRVKARHSTYGEAEFVYAKGVASTAVGSWALLSPDDWSTALLNANDIGDVGISMSANVANQYGWYCVYGKCPGLALTGFVDNGRAYATATDGSVDDTVVDGDLVHKALGASAVNETTLLADFEIHYPYCDDIASND
jgi:hypothetical protein